MNTVALSGNDSVVLNEQPITDMATGDVAILEYPNDIATVKTGKDGNSVYSQNASGKQAILTFKVIRGSNDDKRFLNFVNIQQNAFENTILVNGKFIKNIGDGQGNVSKDTYICGGGIWTKYPGAKSNVDGDAEQSTVEYKLTFSTCVRVIR